MAVWFYIPNMETTQKRERGVREEWQSVTSVSIYRFCFCLTNEMTGAFLVGLMIPRVKRGIIYILYYIPSILKIKDIHIYSHSHIPSFAKNHIVLHSQLERKQTQRGTRQDYLDWHEVNGR